MKVAKHKKGRKLVHLQVPLYDTSLVFFDKSARLEKFFRKNNQEADLSQLPTGVAGSAARLSNGSSSIVVMYLPEDDLQVLAHECVHAAWHVLDYAGVEVDYENHEALAYLVDHIFKEGYQYLQNRGHSRGEDT